MPGVLDDEGAERSKSAERREVGDLARAVDPQKAKTGQRRQRAQIVGKGRPLEIEALTCQLQLKIPNMGTQAGKDETLIVPSTAKGPQALKVEPIVDRLLQTEPTRSVKV